MKLITYSILLIFLSSCMGRKTSFANEKEFQDYLNDADNGFIQSKKSGDFVWDVKLVPSLKNDSLHEVSFQLRINRKDGGSVLDYGGVGKDEALNREGFLSFEIMNSIYLECNEKIIPCSFHHYERNYGLKPSVDLITHFSNVVPKQDVYFVYRDEIFHQGLIRIKFNKELFNEYDIQ